MKRLAEATVLRGSCACGGSGLVANLAPAVLQITHDRGQQHPALGVGQAFGHAVAHGSHQGVRGAQVNTHGNAPLVGVGGSSGLGNLQKRHGILGFLRE